MLMQIDVVDAGAAVDNGIVDHKTFRCMPIASVSIDRHAVDRHRLFRMLAGHGENSRRWYWRRADAFALVAAQPVDQHADFQFGPLLFGLIQRVEDLTPGVVMLQIQSHQIDTLWRWRWNPGSVARSRIYAYRVLNIKVTVWEPSQLCKVLMLHMFKF